MSAPIRPLPVEAAPQRTESAATNSKPDEGPGFGEVLDLHLDEKVEEKKEEPRQEPEKKANDTDASAWAVLGILMAPPMIVQSSQVDRGSRDGGDPQEEGAIDSSTEADAVAGFVDEPPSEELAGPRSRGIRAPAQDVAATADPSSLAQKLTPAPEVQKLPPAQEARPEEVAGKTEESGEKLRGIPVAKQAVVLLNAERNDTSGSLEQQQGRIPVPGMEAIYEQAAVVSRPMAKPAEHPIEFPTDKVVLSLDSFVPSIRVESSNALPDTHRVTEVRAAAVVDAIREHVQVLRAAQANELNVVLRPDANTELVLQLRHVDGQVLLQARCERGDFTWLDSQWNAIQNTLGQQGVRVEPLQAAYRTQDGGGNSTFTPDQRGSRQRDERNFSFEQESSRTGKNSSRPGKTAARMRGWQSWA